MASAEIFALCSFAEVRNGLLTIVSAGITRMWSAVTPMSGNVSLAAMIYVPPEELGKVIDIRIVVKQVDTAERIAEMVAGAHIAAPDEAQPGEGVHIPLVFDLRGIGFPHPGAIDAQLLIDNQPEADLSFWVSNEPPPGAVQG